VEQDLNAWTQTPKDLEEAIDIQNSQSKEIKSTPQEIDQES
jgi:hypothetical protein